MAVVVGRVKKDAALPTIPTDARETNSPIQMNSGRSVAAFRSLAAILNRFVRKEETAAFLIPKLAHAIAAVIRKDALTTRGANVCAPRVRKFERDDAVFQVWFTIVVT